MHDKLELLKREIIRLILLIDNENWVKSKIVLQFPPTENKAYKLLPSFLDSDNNKVKIIPAAFDMRYAEILLDIIFEANKHEKVNQINFQVDRGQYDTAKIDLSFNQEIVDRFEANLPQSQKGKIKAWYISNAS